MTSPRQCSLHIKTNEIIAENQGDNWTANDT